MSDKKNHNDFGEMEIEWLTESDRQLISTFEKFLSLTGMWNNDKKRPIIYILTALTVTFEMVLLYSFINFLEELVMVAHVIHHSVMFADNLTFIDLMYNKERHLRTMLTDLTKTYNYNCDLVKEYHKSCMVERLKQMRFIVKTLKISLVILNIYLHVGFLLEGLVFKSYETLFPIKLPFSFENPIVFATIITLQEIEVFLSMGMAFGILIPIYIPWNHMTVEFDTLKFVINHIEDIVEHALRNRKFKSIQHREEVVRRHYALYSYHIARHHTMILRYFKAVRGGNSLVILALFVSGLICFACVWITFTTDNHGIKLKFFILMMVQFGVIYGWCWSGQQITDASSEIANAVTSSPWWLMPKSARNNLLLVMIGSKKPLVITTPLGQAANNESYMDMIANSYRCFNLVFQIT